MADISRRNQRYQPSSQPNTSYRRTQHINQTPNTVETEAPATETHSSQNVGDNKWSTGEKIAFGGLFVNIILAFVTYLLYHLSAGAANSAEISANAAKKSADLQGTAWDSAKVAKNNLILLKLLNWIEILFL